jgi:hypothetical protein
MNGKPLSIPIVAANAVLPLQASKKHVTVNVLLHMLKLKIIATSSDCMKQVKQPECLFTYGYLQLAHYER